MRFIKFKKIFLCLFLILAINSCKETTDRKMHELRPIHKRNAAATSPVATNIWTKRGLNKNENKKSQIITYYVEGSYLEAQKFIESAKNFVVVVENSAPDWLEDYLFELSQKKPLLKVFYLTNDDCTTNICRSILNLKASFIIVDNRCILLNPLYSADEKGIMYLICDQFVTKAYLDFIKNLIK